MKHFYFLVFFFILVKAESIQAQSIPLEMSLSDTSLVMKSGQIESVTIKIENHSDTDFLGQLIIETKDDLNIITKKEQAIELLKGGSRYISVQMLTKSTTNSGIKRVNFTLIEPNGIPLLSKELSLEVPSIKSVRTEMLTSTSFLPETGNVLEIPVRITNDGNTDQKVKLIVSLPILGLNDSYQMVLPGQADTIVTISKRITPAMSRMEELKINIIGLYDNGDFFSSQSLYLYSPKSNLRFQQDDRTTRESNQNQFTAGVMNLASVSEAYYLRGNVAFQNGKTNGGLNLDMVNWQNGLSVQNTWLELGHGKVGARLGNITRYGDLSLYGRGGEVFFTDTSLKYSLSAGYIEKSYDLINKNAFDLGEAVWLSANRSTETVQLSTLIASDKDSYYNANNKVIINSASLRFKNNLVVGAKVGFGYSQDILDLSDSHPSILTEGSISGNLLKNVHFNSDNLYASGYFPGNRRGSMSLSQRVSWQLPKTTLSANYRYYSFAPRYFKSIAFYSYGSYSHYINLGSSGTIGNFNYNWGPYYTKETGSWNWIDPTEIRSLESGKLSGNIGWRSQQSKQNLSLQVDAGRSWTSRESIDDWQLRGSLSWSYGGFRLMSSAQKGIFYLYEAYRKQLGDDLIRYQIAPGYSQSFFRDKLQLEAGMIYIMDRDISNIIYSGRVNYKIRNAQIFGMAQLSKYGMSDLYQNFQVGITQGLPSFSRVSSEKPGRINIFLYKDKNGNGQYDAGDTNAMGHMIYINNKPFITDNNGRISYKKLPPQLYRIDSPVQIGWFMKGEAFNLEAKQVLDLHIPLQESGRVSGQVEYQKGNELIEFPVNKILSNLSVLAINESGNRLEARTDDKGRFVMFLPPGTYTFSIIGLPENIESIHDSQLIQVSADKIVDGIVFPFSIKEQKVEVKRFSD